MIRRLPAVIAATAMSALVATDTLAQQAVFRGRTTVVIVDVSVKRGSVAVSGLTAKDFVLTDNRVHQEIDLVSVDEVPLDVTLVLDQSWHAAVSIGERLPAALQAIAAHLRPADRLSVVLAATDAVEVLPMTGPVDWPTQGPSLRARGEPAGAESVPSGPGWRDAFNDPTTRSSWMDGLLFALTRPDEPGRRHLVVGVGTLGAGAFDRSILVHTNSLAAAAARSPALFTVALYRPSQYRATIGLAAFRRQVLVDAAEATGGSVRDVSDGLNAVKSILADYRHRYLLRYTVTGVESYGWHAITVSTPASPQYRVEARRGYVGR